MPVLLVALVAEHECCNDEHHSHSCGHNDDEDDPPVSAHKRKSGWFGSGLCTEVKGGVQHGKRGQMRRS